MDRMSDGSVSRPALSVVRGAPTPEELAAVVVALATRGGQPEPVPESRRSEWAAKSRQLRPALTAGPGAWRASALPG
jgi:hypothetical protein